VHVFSKTKSVPVTGRYAVTSVQHDIKSKGTLVVFSRWYQLSCKQMIHYSMVTSASQLLKTQTKDDLPISGGSISNLFSSKSSTRNFFNPPIAEGSR